MSTNIPPSEVKFYPAPPTKKNNAVWWIVGGVVVLLLVCCVAGVVMGGFFYYSSSSNPQGITEIIQNNPALTPSFSDTPVIATEPNVVVPPTTVEPPTSEPPTITNTVEPTPKVNVNGISFTFDPGVAQSVNAETIQGENPAQPNGMPGEVFPQHTKFTFNGYPLSGTFHSPYILVYPAKEFADINPSALTEINDLKQFLADKPTTAERIPFMPFWNAAQMFHSNVAFISFKNGSGVRFLTMYGQAYYPVNNNSMFYTFQGLTDDGAYYIAAVLPASHPSLPANENDVPGGDFDAFVANIETYWTETAANLEAQPLNSFTPDLSKLDAMFASFAITP
jgi:hypothetical protein